LSNQFFEMEQAFYHIAREAEKKFYKG